MEKFFLMIDTSGLIGSVALSDEKQILSVKKIPSENTHSQYIAQFISEIFEENKILPSQLTAVSVSKGPGSYTGLRIGVSTAKGIAYALDIPMIAIDTLQIICCALKEKNKYRKIIPMIDARRMEVYYEIFDNKCSPMSEIKNLILDEKSFEQELKQPDVVFVGNGAEKFWEIAKNANANFDWKTVQSAEFMFRKTVEAFENQDFVDVAYFEPYYFKPFIATKPKNKVLGNLTKGK